MSQSLHEQPDAEPKTFTAAAFTFTGPKLPAVRSDQYSMDNPIFAMKPGDTKQIEFKNTSGPNKVAAAAGHCRATVDDRNLLLFALSITCEENDSHPAAWKQPRLIRFSLLDYLRFCGYAKKRSVGGQQIVKAEQAIERLKNTIITTGATPENPDGTSFMLISRGTITSKEERQRGRGHSTMVEIELCRWLHDAVVGEKKMILTINRKCMRLPAFQRRLYDIARKRVGSHRNWKPILMFHNTLLPLIGTDRVKKQIMYDLRKLQETQPLPNYQYEVTAKHVRIVFQAEKKKQVLPADEYDEYDDIEGRDTADAFDEAEVYDKANECGKISDGNVAKIDFDDLFDVSGSDLSRIPDPEPI